MTANLDPQEMNLLAILGSVLGEGEMERDALRVTVGARGSELGRPFRRLTVCRRFGCG